MSYFKSALVAALLAVSLSNAQPGGGFRGGKSGGRPGGGPGGARGGMDDANFFNITCDSEIDFSCDLHRGATKEDGVFVCRTHTNVMDEGRNNSFPVCIPTDKALESDECGCCGEDCPEVVVCACPCTFTGRHGQLKEGVGVLVDEEEEEETMMCVPKGASRTMVSRDVGITCDTGCL
jgi:hypothetical protein